MAGLGSIGRVAVSNKGVVMKSLGIAGYPAEWSAMMRDLKGACVLKRVRASSSHSYYKAPVCSARWGGGATAVNVGGMEIVISQEEGVTCGSHALGSIVVKGCSLGDGGVWLSVEGMAGAFWLEIHAPMVVTRGVV